MDFRALYSSILHTDGIKACEIFMKENGFPSMEISNITIIIHSTRNFIQFNDKSYIQARGTAMGKKMVPTNANISMWNFEKNLLDNCTDKPFPYLLYIDDILLYGSTVKTNLKNFMYM